MIQVIWFASVLILSLYHLSIFQLRTSVKHQKESDSLPGVSVVIPVHNDLSFLRRFLCDILYQDYPDFEVIVVDDYSQPDESKNLETFLAFWPHVILGKSKQPGKKYALTEGVDLAIHDIILFTDADCKPSCSDWIRTMVKHYQNSPVLGYSPHQKSSGWLNRMIRFETVMTGIQYLSWALKGRPYMSVGRNVLYPKSLLVSEQPFLKSRNIPYGDDDLGLQALSAKRNINVCFDRQAHVYTIPAATFSGWLKQKHRHLSAAHYYQADVWWQPALYGASLIVHWLLWPFMLPLAWWHWIPVFLVALSLRWLTYIRWTRILGDKDTAYSYPLLELMYSAYLAIMGVTTLLVKKKSWN